MITGESRPVPKRSGDRRGRRERWPPTRRSGCGSRRSARRPPWPGSAGWSSEAQSVPVAGPGPGRPGGRAAVLRRRRPPACSPWWCGAARRPRPGVERTVTVLVIACPHALGLAIPLVIAISTALAARAGILVKDRLALERMRTVDVVLFDKTGTLTTGEPTVSGPWPRSTATPTGCWRWPRRSRPTASTRWPGRSWPRPRAHRRRPAPGERLPVDDRPRASRRPSRAPPVAVGGPALLRELDVPEPPELAGRDRRLAEPRGDGAASSSATAGSRRRSPWRTRSGPSPARPSPQLHAAGRGWR